MTVQNTKYGQDAKANPCFWVRCKYVDWDGTKFGTQSMNVSIYPFVGTRHIAQLRAFPIEYHPDAKALKERLVQRGAKAEALAGPNYRSYQGIGWRYGNFGTKDKYNVKGRIVIDTYGWNRFNPTYAIFVSSLAHKEMTLGIDDNEEDEMAEEDEGDDSGMPEDGHFADEEDAARRQPLTTEQKLVCTPLLRGYSLKTKDWLNFFVNSVKDIEWQKDAFDRLVLPKNQKELILGFTESQRKYRDTFDDVIEGT